MILWKMSVKLSKYVRTCKYLKYVLLQLQSNEIRNKIIIFRSFLFNIFYITAINVFLFKYEILIVYISIQKKLGIWKAAYLIMSYFNLSSAHIIQYSFYLVFSDNNTMS